MNENNEFIVGIKMEDKLSITLESFFEPFVQKLYKNSKESGDVTIMCNDNKIVRADRNVLVQDPFFISLFAFKGAQLESPSLSESNTNSSLAVKPGDTSMIDLETFSNESVSHLVEFLYTGSTYVPASIEARCELLFLADYTTNQNLCHLLGRKIEMIDFTPSAIMDVLILTRNRGNLLEFRQSAIDYYRKNKKQIVNCPGYQEKYNIFVDEHLDVDMLKDLIR